MSLIDKLPTVLGSYASLRLVMKAVSDALLSRTLWGSLMPSRYPGFRPMVMMSENPVLLWFA
jgi:hypothetical protein